MPKPDPKITARARELLSVYQDIEIDGQLFDKNSAEFHAAIKRLRGVELKIEHECGCTYTTAQHHVLLVMRERRAARK